MKKNKINFKEIINSLLMEKGHQQLKERLIDQGYGLVILLNDENYYVRAAVAEQGYGLGKLRTKCS